MTDKKVLERFRKDATDCDYCLIGNAIKCNSITEAKQAMMRINVDLVMEKRDGYYWLKPR